MVAETVRHQRCKSLPARIRQGALRMLRPAHLAAPFFPVTRHELLRTSAPSMQSHKTALSMRRAWRNHSKRQVEPNKERRI